MVIVVNDKSELGSTSSSPNPSSVSSVTESETAPTGNSGNDFPEEADGQPPSYEASAASAPPMDQPNPNPNPNPIPSSNFVKIQKNMGAIIGKWRIDTSLPVAQESRGLVSLLSPGPEPNLFLWIDTGTVQADVELVGGEARAFLKAHCALGTMIFKFTNPTNQCALINLRSDTGQVKLVLPRTYIGLIKTRNDLGNVSFSQGVKSKLTIFSEKFGATRGFIGHYEGADFGEDGEEWKGSEIVMQASLGSIGVLYADEYVEPLTTSFPFGLGAIWSNLSSWIPGF